MEEHSGTPASTLQKHVCKIQGSYSENRQKLFKPSPASNVSSSPLMTTAKERERASLWTRELHFV